MKKDILFLQKTIKYFYVVDILKISAPKTIKCKNV